MSSVMIQIWDRNGERSLAMVVLQYFFSSIGKTISPKQLGSYINCLLFLWMNEDNIAAHQIIKLEKKES